MSASEQKRGNISFFPISEWELTRLSDSKLARGLHGAADGAYIGCSLIDAESAFLSPLSESGYDIDPFDPLFCFDLCLAAGFSVYSILNEHEKAKREEQKKQVLEENCDSKIELATEARDFTNYAYLRDILSGIKNARHAVVNPCLLIQHSAYAIFNPIGMALAIPLAASLVYIRKMNKDRKKDHMHNIALLKQDEFDGTNIKSYSNCKNAFNYAVVLFDALTDGAYIFGNLKIAAWVVSTLIGVSIPTGGAIIIVSLVVISVIVLFSIYAKMREEAQKQRQFKIGELSARIKAGETQHKETLKKLIIEEEGFIFAIGNNTIWEGDSEDYIYKLTWNNSNWTLENPEIDLGDLVGEKDEAHEFTSEEIAAIKQKIAEHRANTEKLKHHHYYEFRALISGIKNLDVVVMTSLLMIKKWTTDAVTLFVLGTIGALLSIGYGIMLLLKEIGKAAKRTGESSYANFRCLNLSINSAAMFSRREDTQHDENLENHNPHDESTPLLPN